MSEEASQQEFDIVEVTAEIVAAYVSNNSVQVTELPALIGNLHKSLNNLASGTAQEAGERVEKLTPAQIRKSITPNGLVSFIEGKTYKSMKRHLTKHGLDPHSYRERYGLPGDYPMVAASYAAKRSELAKVLGLGRKRSDAGAGPS